MGPHVWRGGGKQKRDPVSKDPNILLVWPWFEVLGDPILARAIHTLDTLWGVPGSHPDLAALWQGLAGTPCRSGLSGTVSACCIYNPYQVITLQLSRQIILHIPSASASDLLASGSPTSLHISLMNTHLNFLRPGSEVNPETPVWYWPISEMHLLN